MTFSSGEDEEKAKGVPCWTKYHAHYSATFDLLIQPLPFEVNASLFEVTLVEKIYLQVWDVYHYTEQDTENEDSMMVRSWLKTKRVRSMMQGNGIHWFKRQRSYTIAIISLWLWFQTWEGERQSPYSIWHRDNLNIYLGKNFIFWHCVTPAASMLTWVLP